MLVLERDTRGIETWNQNSPLVRLDETGRAHTRVGFQEGSGAPWAAGLSTLLPPPAPQATNVEPPAGHGPTLVARIGGNPLTSSLREPWVKTHCFPQTLPQP